MIVNIRRAKASYFGKRFVDEARQLGCLPVAIEPYKDGYRKRRVSAKQIRGLCLGYDLDGTPMFRKGLSKVHPGNHGVISFDKSLSLLFAMASRSQRRRLVRAFKESVYQSVAEYQRQIKGRNGSQGKTLLPAQTRFTVTFHWKSFNRLDPTMHVHLTHPSRGWIPKLAAYRSLDTRRMGYRLPELKARIAGHLAPRLRKLGVSFSVDQQANIKVHNISPVALARFSQTSRQIHRYHKRHGITRTPASATIAAAAIRRNVEGTQKLSQLRKESPTQSFTRWQKRGQSLGIDAKLFYSGNRPDQKIEPSRKWHNAKAAEFIRELIRRQRTPISVDRIHAAALAEAAHNRVRVRSVDVAMRHFNHRPERYDAQTLHFGRDTKLYGHKSNYRDLAIVDTPNDMKADGVRAQRKGASRHNALPQQSKADVDKNLLPIRIGNGHNGNGRLPIFPDQFIFRANARDGGNGSGRKGTGSDRFSQTRYEKDHFDFRVYHDARRFIIDVTPMNRGAAHRRVREDMKRINLWQSPHRLAGIAEEMFRNYRRPARPLTKNELVVLNIADPLLPPDANDLDRVVRLIRKSGAKLIITDHHISYDRISEMEREMRPGEFRKALKHDPKMGDWRREQTRDRGQEFHFEQRR